jgi:integrase
MSRRQQYRRGRSPHPGVKLKARELAGRIAYRAIYVDPDSERDVYETLEEKDARTIETRKAWAIDKSKDLAKRRQQLDDGAPRASGKKISEAIGAYFEAHPQLRPRTVATYRNATNKFEAWAERAKVASVDELTRARLLDFRKHLITQPKHASVKNGKRGEMTTTSETRGAVVINQELRSVGTVLRYLYELDLFARLDFDDLRRGLKKLKAAIDPPEFLSTAECGQLMRAAIAHDAATFVETRAEHAGDGRKSIGTTRRHPPIAPFTATVLLSGMRVGEALALRWSYLVLDTVDADGKLDGEIRLPSEVTKTKQGRKVRLGVCPLLRELLAHMQTSAGDNEFVFGGDSELARDVVEAARKRLIKNYGAPRSMSWQKLRSTCATVSSNAQSIWGDSAAFASAKRLGHSIVVAESRYTGQTSVARAARTLEAAMGIEAELAKLLPTPKRSRSAEGSRIRSKPRRQTAA